jgi:quercetin dioxygenase-like cupin family protein
MTAQPFVVSPQSRTQSLRVVGEHITVLASAAQTGSYEIFFQAGPEGRGPPPHNHPWDEAFYVLRGEVAFGIGDRESLAVEAHSCSYRVARRTGSAMGEAVERCSR